MDQLLDGVEGRAAYPSRHGSPRTQDREGGALVPVGKLRGGASTTTIERKTNFARHAQGHVRYPRDQAGASGRTHACKEQLFYEVQASK